MNYVPDRPVPDPDGPPRTYSEDPEQGEPDTSTDTMPDDDFGPTNRSGNNSNNTEEDPFTRPVLPEDSVNPSQPPVTPMDEDMLDGNITLRILPVRTRVHAQAQYHLPRVARMDVTPQTPWSPAPESRIASK